MSMQTEVTWTCDLCESTGKTETDHRQPVGWLALEFDHPIAEREWFTRHLCGDCVRKVIMSHERLVPPPPTVVPMGLLNQFIRETWKVTPTSKQLAALQQVVIKTCFSSSSGSMPRTK